MPSRSDRNDFGPPSDTGRLRAFGWALLVHALLIGALTWGVSWKRSDTSPTFSAELWSSTAQEAAPRSAASPPPLPPPLPLPPSPPVPQPLPNLPMRPLPIPAPAPAPNVDIALEQEKKRKLLKQRLELEKEKEAEKLQDKRQAAMDAKAEQDQLKQVQAKRLADENKKQDAARVEAAKLAAKNKAVATAAAASATAAANASAVEEQRKQNLARTMGMAGASGDDSSKGTAKVASGPTAGYGGKVRAKVKPNIVFTDAVDENIKAEVEVRSALDGTITSHRLVKSSGNKAWDDAVIKAIIRTETMPRDTDGRVPPVMILEFRPRD